MDLGDHFTLGEFEVTRTGLPNSAPPGAILALGYLVEVVLDPLRIALGRQVNVTSGYRCPEVNRAVNGSRTSQHMVGEAADIKVEGIGAEALAMAIVILGGPFDQILWYDPERGGHVHVSYTAKRTNRRQMLHAPASGGYKPWMTP